MHTLGNATTVTAPAIFSDHTHVPRQSLNYTIPYLIFHIVCISHSDLGNVLQEANFVQKLSQASFY